jgi:hypothetical protein
MRSMGVLPVLPDSWFRPLIAADVEEELIPGVRVNALIAYLFSATC